MNRYSLTFKFVDTEAEAKAFCKCENANGSYYKRKTKKAHYTPWESQGRTEHKFICWYYQ